MTSLKFFNHRGLAEYEKHLNVVRQTGIWQPLDVLSDDPSLTVAIGNVSIELPSSFKNRLECGRFFSDFFDSCRIELMNFGVDPQKHVGLWAWLSARMGDFLKGPGTDPFIGEVSRWTFMPEDFGRYYRHLLAGPYALYEMHRADPRRVEILLYNEVTKPNTAYVEQIASRPLLVGNPAAMELIHDLYFDYSNHRPRRLKLGEGPQAGDIRRLGVVFNQLALIWDISGMSKKEIAAVLPREFSSMLKNDID